MVHVHVHVHVHVKIYLHLTLLSTEYFMNLRLGNKTEHAVVPEDI